VAGIFVAMAHSKESAVRFNLEEAIDRLQRAPAAFDALLLGAADHWVKANYGPDTFSPFDVVGHLIHGEQTDWMPRLKIILECGQARPFQPFDRYAMYQASRGRTMTDLLGEFRQLRSRNLAELVGLNLTPDQLQLRGQHPALGVVTAGQLLATWVTHDLHHLAQVCKAMARQYRSEVGPWREYISILG
jgi:hypothetical protein